MGKLTLQEIAKILTQKNGLTQREASQFAAEMFSVILERLQDGDSVKVKGLGTFKIINVESRESVSVRTGERVVIDGHAKVSFTPDTVMKELVNKPFSQFETVILNDGVEFDDIKDDADEEEEAKPAEVTEPVQEAEPVEEVVEDAEPAEIIQLVGSEEPQTERIEDTPQEEIQEETQEKIQEEIQEEAKEEVREDVLPEAEILPEKEVVVEDEVAMEDEVVTEETTPQEDAFPEEEPLIEYEDEEPESHWGRWLVGVLGVLVLITAAAYGGYKYGQQHHSVAIADTVFVRDTVYMAEQQETTDLGDAAEVVPEEPAEATVVKEEAKPAPKEEVKAEPKKETADPYASKDERVRLGAYRIVGTAQEVTIQQGQTFYSICRAYLGPDMECYVEVYNNLPRNPQIKAGQVLKIPKLELKKRRK